MKEERKTKQKKSNLVNGKDNKGVNTDSIIVYCKYSSNKTITNEQRDIITNILKGTIFEVYTTDIIQRLEKAINIEYDKKKHINDIKAEKELAELILTLLGDNVRIASSKGNCCIPKCLADERCNYYKRLFEDKKLRRKAINYNEAKNKLLTDYDFILTHHYMTGKYADIPEEVINPDDMPTDETDKIQPKYRANPYIFATNEIVKEYPNIVNNPEQWIPDEMVEEYKNIEIFDSDTSEESLRKFIEGCDEHLNNPISKLDRLQDFYVVEIFRYYKLAVKLKDLNRNGTLYNKKGQRNDKELSKAQEISNKEQRIIYDCLDALDMVDRAKKKDWESHYNTACENAQRINKPCPSKDVFMNRKKENYLKAICYNPIKICFCPPF